MSKKESVYVSRQVLFIQGAGDVGYDGDLALVASLRTALGKGYKVSYPEMPADEEPHFGSKWPEAIGEALSSLDGEVILAGHSLGASMLLKYLSENKVRSDIAGVFLIAAPYWSGNQDWMQPLKLKEHFSADLPKDLPFFFYKCADDDVVPLAHLVFYKQNVPWAVFREMPHGGHQLNNDLTAVAHDIKSLS